MPDSAPQCPFLPGRRAFLGRAGVGVAGMLLSPGLLEGCAPAGAHAHIRGSLHNPSFRTGHQLWRPDRLPAPARTLHTDVLIVGGGVAGLSARRWLHRHGHPDALLLELEEGVGGNAAGGHNAVSAYPWGAHYLPLPDPRNRELLDFLSEAGTITSFDAAGQPRYNPYHLCHDPEERLSIGGHWQAGLVPELGVPAADRAEIARFFTHLDELRQARGADGRDAFRIPLDESSADPAFRQLDALSFADYLDREQYTSPYLRWYLDYCCHDDYGAPAAAVSAWAGLHYFAARKGRGPTAAGDDVLTWPQGNAFLVEHLRQAAPTAILPRTLAYQIAETPTGVQVLAYHADSGLTTRIEARRVLLATPHFVTRRLLRGVPGYAAAAPLPHHAPWLVANLTVNGLPQGPGQPLSWDNVRYGSAAVGYVHANQQDLRQLPERRVITFYWPLTDAAPAQARRQAAQTTYDQWLTRVLAELELMHPGITPRVEQADLRVWGHGMVAPTPGYLWHGSRQQAARPLRQRFYFAHSDLSGISIFEEAFYQGIRAAREMLLPA